MRSRPLGDELLVRRTARRLALQAAGLVAAAMLLLIGVVTLVVVRGQDRATDALLRTTVASADDVGDPPAGTWLVIERAGQIASSPGLPDTLGRRLASLRTTTSTRGSVATLSGDDEDGYRVVTRQRGDTKVQVVLDLRPQAQERRLLLDVMGAAALVSMMLSVLVGVLLGRRSVRPLAQALILQRTFVADASHELRTPLTLLSTRVQLLEAELRKSSLDGQILEDSRGVVADVQRLGEVVEDLLVAADPRKDIEHTLLDLTALVGEVAASASAHAARVGVAVAISPGQEALTVRGTVPALRRAVLALVDNAIEHTPPDGTVTLGVRSHRSDVIVSVSDTGPGIPPEATASAVRRFHSGGQRSGRAHYGLGLALTNDVVNRHGGQLRIVQGGAGAVVELVLPAAHR